MALPPLSATMGVASKGAFGKTDKSLVIPPALDRIDPEREPP
jgi:hypothetical protein